MYSKDRIVITGMGAITPLGGTKASILHSLQHGVSGICHIPDDSFSNLSVHHAGIVQPEYLEQDALVSKWRGADKKEICFGLYALEQAFAEAQYQNHYAADRIGIYVGGEPPSISFTQQLSALNTMVDVNGKIDTRRITALPLCKNWVYVGSFTQLILSHISREFCLHGPAYFHLGTCSASAQAIGESARMLRSGVVDLMVTGGISSKIDHFAIARLARVKALACTEGNPAGLSRPFDAHRHGFTMAEGAVLFVLERLEDALKRGATPLAEIAGYGAALDGYSVTDPHPESLGMILSMERAIEDAGLHHTDIQYINAHGTSTVKNDIYETQAIKHVFQDSAYNVSVSSTKSMHGHLMSAAGAMEALVSVLSLQHQFVPPTINYQYPDERCDLHYTPNVMQEKKIHHVLSNSFGLGGQNASLVISEVGGKK